MKTLIRTVFILLFLSGAACADSLVAYDDQLQNSFQDWSWATHNMAATSPVHAGTHSISFEPDSWTAVYLHRDGGVAVASYDGLEFWIHGGPSGGQHLSIVFGNPGGTLATVDLNNYLPGGTLAGGAWVHVRIAFDPIPALTGQAITEIYFQDATGGNQSAAYLDDILFTERPVGPLTLSVDPNANRHPISPLIYGVSSNDSPSASQPPYPVNRWGGNATTRYNWQQDVSNRAADWYFENIPNATNVGQLPNNSTADRFIDSSRGLGEEPIITVPLIGWTPIDRNVRCGYSIAKYGAQQANDPYYPDCGNGRHTNGTQITGNDPLDASLAIGPTFVTGWMAHIAGRVGSAAAGGVRFFELDNEPMLWNSTHIDVHPAAVDYTEMWQRTQNYASAMKTQDPATAILGPVTWGWCDIFYSAKDGCGPGADYAASGPFLEWYLQQAKNYETAHGVRIVDYLDIHYYPQEAGVGLSNDESAGTSALRLRSVRSLYDPTYIDESWINASVQLIPRMKDIIGRKYPGTKLAITEYNWGNDTGLTSALAQAEVLAIFGRESVDLATRWIAPASNTRVEDSFKLFLNYDGAGSKITGDSVSAVSNQVDNVSIYAIRRSDNRLYVLLFNKSVNAQTPEVVVNGGVTGGVSLWGFDAGSQLQSKGTGTITANGFTVSLPARSVRLAVTTMNCPLPAKVTNLHAQKSGANLKLTWTNVSGGTGYTVYEDASMTGSFATSSGTSTSGTSGLTIPRPSSSRYYVVAAQNACGEGPRK